MNDENVAYLELVLGFTLFEYLFHTWLDIRQLQAVKKGVPKQLQAVYDETTHKKTQAYTIDKWYFGFVKGVWDIVTNLVLLYLKLLPVMWIFTVEQTKKYLGATNEIIVTIIFLLGLGVIQSIFSLPWDLYGTFVVEQKHGFNKQTLLLFFVDQIKQFFLGLIIGPPIIAGLTYILMVAGPYLVLWLWLFVLGISLIGLTIYPTLIAPLFNKFDPLQEGSLRQQIEELASSLKFPLKKLFVVDGSTRSSHSNAYMYGFFNNKRIVLYDTLVEQCTEKQVVAVLAHELGHWKLRHTPILFVMSQLLIIAQFSLFGLLRSSDSLYRSFGFEEGLKPVFISLILFQLISQPMDAVLMFGQNVISRMFEFQADRFAVDLEKTEDLKAALVTLQKENKSSVNVDPLYSAYHYSHPPLVERLKAIDATGKKMS
eukprot:TRINITY_DN6450_c0_g2_i1.p1 TRINITY_DN6450_c0_g2~~TRINITY_DN6450_c0_g2_i1.p1  ORF type:complete len:454 (-),score=47.08 TRINITY_DN6450_c0_g2_i1:541-1821(-)